MSALLTSALSISKSLILHPNLKKGLCLNKVNSSAHQNYFSFISSINNSPILYPRANFALKHFQMSQNSRQFSGTVNAQSDASITANKLEKVGFLGMGIMGTAMAKNLLNSGYEVTVWNRTASKCNELVQQGAKTLSTPKDVMEQCDVIFAMLADPKSAVEVACGEFGVSKADCSGKGYVDVSTVDCDTSKLIGQAVQSAGGSFLEAPVSGSKKPAMDGALIFMTAGDRSLFDRVSPMLDVMGKSKFFLGEVGNAAAMKIVVNMVMGSMMVAFSEGLILGEKRGLDPNTILEIISQGAINAPVFAMKGPAMLKKDFSTSFPLKHQQKDLRLALGMAEELKQTIPVAAAANEAFKLACMKGLEDLDFSAVVEALREQKE